MTAEQPLVSTVIPTYNRVNDVPIAVRSALAQTYANQEIIVVDDGSSDETRLALDREFGDQIRYFYKENGGVSDARNHGIERARGAYIAFLDSDDEWLPDKLERQVAYLQAHPGYGMVITDVLRVDADRRPIERFRRRDVIPRDGWVLPYVLRNPALAPASALVTTEACRAVGGFDATLRTAEDLDFHLKIARRYQEGVIDEPLARCMRGHEGLSSLDRTYRDYLDVVERFLADAGDEIAIEDRRAALFNAYLQNARGHLWDGDLAGSLRFTARGAACARDATQLRALARLGGIIARNLASRARDRVRSR